MKKSEQTHYEWLFYAISFLGLAKIGCKELIDQKHRDKKSLTEDLLYGTKESNSRFLLISIFFNLRHALELFIKGVGVDIDGNYWNTHNLDNLMKDLELRLKTLFKNKNNDKIFQKIEDLKPVMKQYFCWSFFKNTKPIKDYKNELFRYPSNENEEISKYTNFFKKPNIFLEIENFNTVKVKKILNDIQRIHSLFFLIKSRINITRLEKLRGLGQSYTTGWSEN